MTPSWLVRRALAAGAVAGIVGATVLATLGEPQIRRALRVEDARRAAEGATDHPMFSRTTQVIGGITANIVFGLLLGAVFGVVFVVVRHRLRATTDLGRSLTVAACGFLVMGLVPALKYPSNPPAVGDPDTIAQRTWSYLAVIAIAVISVIAAWKVAGAVRRSGRSAAAQLASAVAVFILLTTITFLLLPPSAAVPADMPSDVLWRFRLASIGSLAAIWTTLGVGLGWLADRGPKPRRARTGALSPT